MKKQKDINIKKLVLFALSLLVLLLGIKSIMYCINLISTLIGNVYAHVIISKTIYIILGLLGITLGGTGIYVVATSSMKEQEIKTEEQQITNEVKEKVNNIMNEKKVLSTRDKIDFLIHQRDILDETTDNKNVRIKK